MGDNFSEKIKSRIKSAVKGTVKTMLVPILIAIATFVAIIVLISACVYFLTIDDGSYKEDDWSSTPYASKQYTSNLNITKDGRISANMSTQHLWDKMQENGSRVDLYLNSPKELIQLMYAQMVTQLPDLREDTSKFRTMEEWREEFENLNEEEGEYDTYIKRSNNADSGDFQKYNLTDAELKGLTAVALREQGTVIGAAAEASLMANLFESSKGSGFSSIVDYVKDSGWFANAHAHYADVGRVNQEALDAVKSVLIDGKRTLPKYVDEHDFRGDITSVTNDGVAIDKYDNSAYIPHKTVIKNSMRKYIYFL